MGIGVVLFFLTTDFNQKDRTWKIRTAYGWRTRKTPAANDMIAKFIVYMFVSALLAQCVTKGIK